MNRPIHVLGIAGSLRSGSLNTAALRAAAELLPEGMTLEIYDLSAIPMYNGDVDANGAPAAVQDFKNRIAAADALLIATPEYNYSIPGVLKNALDWASRPAGRSPLNGKPVAIMGVATSRFGTVRAQMHLRLIAQAMNMLALNKPEVMITGAADKFDAQGRLIDETSRQQIAELLAALAEWTGRLGEEALVAPVEPALAVVH
jgi:chromate reductase, NAD(P)H dehydrogenase (quinone)